MKEAEYMQQVQDNKQVPNYNNYELLLNGRSLTREEREHFQSCLITINDMASAFLFRGDKLDKMAEILGTTFKPGQHRSFNHKFYMIGTKGRYFQREETPEITMIQRDNEQYGAIFIMLNEIITGRYDGEQRKYMREFLKREDALCRYFLNWTNMPKFVKHLQELPYHQQLLMTDYYLALLHNLDTSGFYADSFLVSTTTSLNKAWTFANARRNAGNGNSIVLHGWLPKEGDQLLSAATTEWLQDKLADVAKEFPFYEKLIFYPQQEVPLKGFFFPHYIFGYNYWRNCKMVMEVNPAIFKVKPDDLSTWDNGALPIDQTSIKELMKTTRYQRYGSRYKGGHYSISDRNSSNEFVEQHDNLDYLFE